MELSRDPETRSITGTAVRADGGALAGEEFEALYRATWPAVVD